MDRMLGEVVRVEEVKPKELIWLDKGYRAIFSVQYIKDDPADEDAQQIRLRAVDGYTETFLAGENVIRGWRFLVGRRTD